MKYRFIDVMGFGFAAVSLLAISISLIRFGADIVDSHQRGGDLATWIGAIGTVGTLLGTIWIATSQQRRQRDEALAIAKLTLMNMQFRMNTLRRQLEKAAIALDGWNPGLREAPSFTFIGEELNRYASLTIEEVEKILPLSNPIALRMAASIDYVSYCTSILIGGEKNPKIQTDEARLRACSDTSELLAAAAVNYRVALTFSAKIAGRSHSEFEDNGIQKIAEKALLRRSKANS